MMQITLENMRKLYKLDNIIRYNPHVKIHHETVAAHSYFVTLFTKMLCDNIKVKDNIKLMALNYAIIHDIPEIEMNDITHDAKKLIPGLNEAIQKFEKYFIRMNFPYDYNVMCKEYEELSKDEIIAKLIVEYADILSVVQYCDNERMLGNKAFEEIFNSTLERLSKIKEQLERVGLECQEIIV